MSRYPWKPNHGSEQPCRLVTYDCESRQSNVEGSNGYTAHSFRLCVAHLWRRKGLTWRLREAVAFDRPELWWSWLYSHARPREPLWVYAHNHAFDFTLTGGWGQLDCGNLSTIATGRTYTDRNTGQERQARDWRGIMAVDNLPWILDAKSDRGTLRFVDVMNYLPVSSDTCAKWIGARKADLPDSGAADDVWLDRCEADVSILDETVMRLLNLWSGRMLGTWQPTIGGLAFSSFRHTSPDSGIVAHGDEPATPEQLAPFWIAREPFPLDDLDVSRMERRAYYGGRVVVGYVGDVTVDGLPVKWFGVDDASLNRPTLKGKVTALDVNGLYASVMRSCVYPVEMIHAWRLTDVDELRNLSRDYPAVADVELYSPDHAWPCRLQHHTSYLRGHVKTTLAGPELALALEMGVVRRCHAAAFYHPGTPFREYVDYWWGKRLDAIASGDMMTATLCKLMLNALYGKLGQRRPSWRTVTDVPAAVRWGPFAANRPGDCHLSKFRAVAGVVQEQGERLDCRHTCTAIAACVTAWGRTVMGMLRNIAGERQWLYQDTDSLFVMPRGLDRLVDSGLCHATELGKLKVTGTYDQLSIYGHKDYNAGGLDTVAGKKGNARPVGERSWEQTMFERSVALIAREPDGTVLSWEERFTPRNLAGGYSVDGEGWTRPVRVG